MKLRRLLTPIAAGLMASWVVGVLAGTDMIMMWVQAAVAWATPIDISNNIVWVFIDATVVLVLSAPGIIAAVCLYAWRNRGYEHNRCKACGYDLTALTEPRCPECGTGFESPEQEDG